METNNNTTDDSVTITDALKRIGNQAPTRQSFYAAVNKGKIREVTDKINNPYGKRMISWTSVLEYMAQGGFKPRGTANRNVTETGDPTVKPTPEVTPAPLENTTSGNGDTNSPEPESVPIAAVAAEYPNTPTEDSNLPHTQAKQKHSNTERKPIPKNECPPLVKEAKANGSHNEKGRRSPPLRMLKNSLRHLDFESAKNLRDWMDNRLLTVLRPTSRVTRPDAEIQQSS